MPNDSMDDVVKWLAIEITTPASRKTRKAMVKSLRQKPDEMASAISRQVLRLLPAYMKQKGITSLTGNIPIPELGNRVVVYMKTHLFKAEFAN